MFAQSIRSFCMTMQPEHDESYRGFLTRALSKTPVRLVSDLFNIAEIKGLSTLQLIATQSDKCALGRLAALFDVDVSTLAALGPQVVRPVRNEVGSMRILGASFPFAFWEKTHRRFAPRALQNAPFHRTLWDFRGFSFDTDTHETLLQTCRFANRI